MADPPGRRLGLWITYARRDDDQGDFAYLVQELRKVDVEATYDRVALVPGRSIWDQIGDRITKGPIDGWASLCTPRGLESDRCREELDYALNRALATKGRTFPLIGLLHQVQVEDLPPALQVRLCVNLSDPEWTTQVRAGLEGKAPPASTATKLKFIFGQHENFRGTMGLHGIEVRPRYGEITPWRLLVPVGTRIERWGHGASGGGEISGVRSECEDGPGPVIRGIATQIFGSADRLSASISAYLTFRGEWPPFVGFTQGPDPSGTSYVELFTLRPRTP